MSINEHPPQNLHVPVLLESSLQLLHPNVGEIYFDLTAGYGGHAAAFLNKTNNYTAAVLVDRDDMAIESLQSFALKGVRLLHTDFVSAAETLVREAKQCDVLLVDLGVSSPQLDREHRGFSFRGNGPLDMRMDRRTKMTAADIVNSYSEAELEQIIVKYGEEPRSFAKRIAHAIVAHRPFYTTEELAAVISEQHRGRWQKVHPATRTFQALRIVTNDELGQVEQLLPLLPQLLKPGGRVGIISFHSLEDRLVKQFLKSEADSGYEATLEVVTKKPIRGDTDDVHNPRSRSAKLRVAVKK